VFMFLVASLNSRSWSPNSRPWAFMTMLSKANVAQALLVVYMGVRDMNVLDRSELEMAEGRDL
jgi:hypothetical protein